MTEAETFSVSNGRYICAKNVPAEREFPRAAPGLQPGKPFVSLCKEETI